MPDDPLSDFEKTTFTHDGKTRDVFRKGTGPAVIVMAEIPGITPKVAGFARKVADIGCTAVMPHLFGEPGLDPRDRGTAGALVHMVRTVGPICISREFSALATGKTSPVIDWLRALGAHEHERCGGPGIGAIGMCFTGGFALAMATHPSLLAPVLSQPSLPFAPPWKKQNAHNIDISPADLATVQQRCAVEGLTVLGLKFEGDNFVPEARFKFLEEKLGPAFIAVRLPDSAANPNAVMKNPHSVVTEHLIDEEGQPTWAALNQVLDLFRTRLISAS
jgi:dienelactone hydrolase